MNSEKKPCTSCGVEFSIEGFEPYKFGKICKKCRNLRAAALRMSSVDKYVQSTMSRLKIRSKKAGVPFELTYQHLLQRWATQDSKCFYTDIPLEIKRFRETKDESPSVDRIVPELGYVDGNVVWCINRINRIKNDVSLEEMKVWMPVWYDRIKHEF